MIKVNFKMAYRFLEGFAKSFLVKFLPELKLPTYSLDHIGIDLKTQKIVAEMVTESSVGDSKMTKQLLDQIPGVY